MHILNVLKRHGKVTRNVFEKDSLGKWHIHGVVELPNGFLRKKICVGGYAVKLKEMWNEEGWEDYMSKEQLGPDRNQTVPGPLKEKQIGPCPCDKNVCADPDELSFESEPSPTSMLKRPEIQADLHYLFGESIDIPQ